MNFRFQVSRGGGALMTMDYPTIIAKFDAILSRGLCAGVGERDGQMCVEAAICAAMELPFGDDPVCVARAVRGYKIHLNDSEWSSTRDRANGLRDVGIAQIGSSGIVDDAEFAKSLSEKTIRRLIPALFREIFFDQPACLDAASRCEIEGTADAAADAARAARAAADAARAADAAADAAARAARAADATARAARAADATLAARAAADAARLAQYAAADASNPDKYLLLSAQLCLEVLVELKSPGCLFVEIQ